MKVVWAGSYEPKFSRNKKLARLLELIPAEVTPVRVDIWAADRVATATRGKLKTVARLCARIPLLLLRLFRTPTPDVYLVSYPGWFDLPAVWFVARMKRRPVVFDPFISLYDTVVVDRQMFESESLVGRVTRVVDRLALRLADVVLADTTPHLEYFDSLVPGVMEHGGVVPVGADDTVFFPRSEPTADQKSVLFYGTFVPLQGAPTVVAAAQLLESKGVRFVMIGEGQDRPRVESQIREQRVGNVELLDAVPLVELPGHICRAAVCLGIFGESPKASRVVPHKVYECLAMRRPIVTRASKAIDEALSTNDVVTVPPGDPSALADAIAALLEDPDRCSEMAHSGHERYRQAFHEAPLSEALREVLSFVEQDVSL